MKHDSNARQEAEWRLLHDRIDKTLAPFGKNNAFGRGDYLLVDDNWGDYRQKLEVQNLNLLQPHIIKALQALLAGNHDWEIMLRVDVSGKEKEWPAMGLIIHNDEIIDDLRRELLPEPFRNFVYGGAKPLKKIGKNDKSYIFRRALK